MTTWPRRGADAPAPPLRDADPPTPSAHDADPRSASAHDADPSRSSARDADPHALPFRDGDRPAPSRRVRGSVVAAVAVLAVAVVAALVVALAAPSTALRFTVRPAPMLLVAGVVLAAVVLVAGAAAARRRSRADAEVRHAQAAGRRAERDARRRFLARLDHELKNPVTAIRAAVAAGADGGDDAGRARATLVSQSTRLAALVTDLRKLAELETQEIEDEDVDMAEVVRDAVEDVTAQAVAAGGPRPDVVVTLPTVPWPLPHVRGDVDLLYLAVYNLLGNAVKFSPPGTRIEVRGTDEDGTVVVEVADSGPGIPPDEVDVVFDELARGRDARGLPGSGLGLALVRVIAARHGGRATLRSRPAQGTSVRLHLPTRRPPR